MATAINKRCIKYPNTFSLTQGNTLLADEIESINQSIALILSTSKGELFGDPTFGSTIKEFFYDYVGESMNQELIYTISEELNDQEPRIIVSPSNIGVTTENSTVKITITYDLKYTDITSEFTYITQIQEGD